MSVICGPTELIPDSELVRIVPNDSQIAGRNALDRKELKGAVPIASHCPALTVEICREAEAHPAVLDGPVSGDPLAFVAPAPHATGGEIGGRAFSAPRGKRKIDRMACESRPNGWSIERLRQLR